VLASAVILLHWGYRGSRGTGYEEIRATRFTLVDSTGQQVASLGLEDRGGVEGRAVVLQLSGSTPTSGLISIAVSEWGATVDVAGRGNGPGVHIRGASAKAISEVPQGQQRDNYESAGVFVSNGVDRSIAVTSSNAYSAIRCSGDRTTTKPLVAIVAAKDPSIVLTDGRHESLALGRIEINDCVGGAVETRPSSSIVLFDKRGCPSLKLPDRR
jgi:hypothetical protein